MIPNIKLNNGKEMPMLGLGTYMSKENEGEIAVKDAIDLGYRHIDSAMLYKNEAEVGRAIRAKIKEGVVTRNEIFLVTKLWNIHHSPEKVEQACKKSLEKFGLDYIDLYLIHYPVGYIYVNDETLVPLNADGKIQLSDVDYLVTWKAMENLVKQGLVRSIGVSNFNSEQIDRILKNCEIKPVTNQIECNPSLNQKKLIKFCQDRDIIVTAYCPLARPKPQDKKPDFLFSDDTKALAEKYNKTPAQIVMRYLIDIGTVPIPKSINQKRIKENMDVFDFHLNENEIKIIDQFNTGERIVDVVMAKHHKYYPLHIEF